jgi:hypothetical protein
VRAPSSFEELGFAESLSVSAGHLQKRLRPTRQQQSSSNPQALQMAAIVAPAVLEEEPTVMNAAYM